MVSICSCGGFRPLPFVVFMVTVLDVLGEPVLGKLKANRQSITKRPLPLQYARKMKCLPCSKCQRGKIFSPQNLKTTTMTMRTLKTSESERCHEETVFGRRFPSFLNNFMYIV